MLLATQCQTSRNHFEHLQMRDNADIVQSRAFVLCADTYGEALYNILVNKAWNGKDV
jgi:hypothetical protein